MACVPDQKTSHALQIPGETFYKKTDNNWSISCWEKYTTGVGKLAGHNECTLVKAGTGVGLAVIASSAGRQLSKPTSADSDVCGISPKLHGVDGRNINKLSYQEQIDALSSGRFYYTERQIKWPYCDITAGEVTLSGFSEAYAVFDQQSKARGW